MSSDFYSLQKAESRIREMKKEMDGLICAVGALREEIARQRAVILNLEKTNEAIMRELALEKQNASNTSRPSSSGGR